MLEQYVSDAEYRNYYQKLNNLRSRIAAELPLRPDTCILDVATGPGLFASEVAKRHSSLRIIGVDICQDDARQARANLEKANLTSRVEILKMDATQMAFPAGRFDLAVNFLGLEDIHMTRGKTGVQRTFIEVSRVLKPGSNFCFVVMPPEEMETEAQEIEVALFSYICNATWLSAKEYETMAEKAGLKLIEKRSYYTGKKLSPEQAKAEIRFACDNVPRLYKTDTRSFEEAWARFGQSVSNNGLGHYSKTVLLATQKVRNVE
jgi:ubiquinone/menaquinone biosynthesis C-methylase UbiE